MARVLTVYIGKEMIEQILKGETIEIGVADSAGQKWKAALAKTGITLEEGFALSIGEVPKWILYIEGHPIGTGQNENPGDALREAFAAAGLTSMPEAVEAKAINAETGDAYSIFTLEGSAYCVPVTQFAEEVAKSSNWTTARQAKRPEIDALMKELKALPRG